MYTSIFSAMFSRGDKFLHVLFAYLEDEVFTKRDVLLKERMCTHSLGAESRKKSHAKHFGYKLATGLHLKKIQF